MKELRQQAGVTLVELMVALSIGSFLMIGAVQVYNQSRHAFVINESIARVQETAQFAMDTIEADLRLASNWGRQSRGSAIVGRSLTGDRFVDGVAAFEELLWSEPLGSHGPPTHVRRSGRLLRQR